MKHFDKKKWCHQEDTASTLVHCRFFPCSNRTVSEEQFCRKCSALKVNIKLPNTHTYKYSPVASELNDLLVAKRCEWQNSLIESRLRLHYISHCKLHFYFIAEIFPTKIIKLVFLNTLLLPIPASS